MSVEGSVHQAESEARSQCWAQRLRTRIRNAAAARATDEYAAVKQEHPKVERGLGELVNRYEGRRARYRGLDRVRVQKGFEGTIHNVKRMIEMLDSSIGFVMS